MKNIKGYAQALTESQESEELDRKLIYDVRMDRPDSVRDLLQKGASPDATDDSGMTALGWAADKGHTRIFMQLIDAGADANLPTEGSTPLCSVISGEAGPGETLKMVEILLRAGADPNATDRRQRTPLCLAAYNDVGLDVMKALLDAGADANITDDRVRVPLYWAERSGQPDVARLLILRGADPLKVFKDPTKVLSFFNGDIDWMPDALKAKLLRMKKGKSAFGM